MTDEPHQCFTVRGTSYLRNLDREDLRGECIAVHYQKPPEKTEAGTSIGLCFPFLVLANYVEGAQEQAEKVARILNLNWYDTSGVPADVRRLVIAARNVAFDDGPSREALRELDQASEAFAERIPWDDEPESADA